MELLGPSAAGLCVLGIGFCLYVVLAAGRVRMPDDPPDVEVELDLLYRRLHGDPPGDVKGDVEGDVEAEAEAEPSDAPLARAS